MARRSARLSKANPRQSAQPVAEAANAAVLSSVLESDEFQDAVEQWSANNTPGRRSSEAPSGGRKTRTTSLMATPKTEPKPSRGEMHPKTVHPTTAEPDSGFKLGFVDIDKSQRQSMGGQNTPSKTSVPIAKAVPSPGAAPAARPTTASAFQFTFNSESQLSEDAKKLMAQVRADAAKIKTELVAEREAQERKDQDAEQMFDGPGAGARKIAQPRGKAGRFSDVHMAQFRKMDSIANHPSAFRARPGYIRPTAQSLKRSGSKAELDAPERPRTAGKGAAGHLAPPPPSFVGRSASASPFKSVPQTSTGNENMNQAKRARRSELEDVSASRPATADEAAPPLAPTGLAKSRSTVLFPTKASLARSGGAGAATQAKPSMLPRSNSARSVKPTSTPNRPRFSSASVSRFTSKLLEARKEAQNCATAQSAARTKPLPPLPTEAPMTPTKAAPVRQPAASASRLPTLSGLRSILRSPQKTAGTGLVAKPGVTVPESAKKVDFTPSVKSRYAVKLAAASPSPAKMLREQDGGDKRGPIVPYDPAAYVVEADSDETWEEEDASSPIDYPVLPPIDLSDQADSFIHKARGHTGRESGEFKSIFTTLHPSNHNPPATLASASPALNKPHATANGKQGVRSPSKSTIRRVRLSEVTASAQPLEDRSVAIMAHGLPAKKRRRASDSVEPPEVEKRSRHNNEGCRRGGKRARMTLLIDETKENKAPQTQDMTTKSAAKKSAAREQAAKHARDRKTRGKSLVGLTTSRLNALARPKSRG
ncbi:hypothetical protein DV735_g361, partial [Chaetothyriales sp. CBS 134920]